MKIALFLVALGCVSTVPFAQVTATTSATARAKNFELTTRIQPQDGAAGDVFGTAIDMDGDLLAIGAPGRDDMGSGSGAVYLYRSVTGQGWCFEHKLLAPDGTSDDSFGYSVAIDGERVLVGAPAADGVDGTGAAYVFHRDVSGWGLESKLQPASPNPSAPYDSLGSRVAISGNHLAASGRIDGQDGAVFLFENTAYSASTVFTWTPIGEVIPSEGLSLSWWGWVGSLELEGDLLLTGVPYGFDSGGTSAGRATVYGYESGGYWDPEQNLWIPGEWVDHGRIYGSDRDHFLGWSVSLSEGRALTTSFGDEHAGSVAVYGDLPASTVATQRIFNPNPGSPDLYGIDAAFDGDRMVVSKRPFLHPSTAGGGRVHAYRQVAQSWVQVSERSIQAAGFGNCVTLSGEHYAVGAAGSDVGSAVAVGSVFVLRFP